MKIKVMDEVIFKDGIPIGTINDAPNIPNNLILNNENYSIKDFGDYKREYYITINKGEQSFSSYHDNYQNDGTITYLNDERNYYLSSERKRLYIERRCIAFLCARDNEEYHLEIVLENIDDIELTIIGVLMILSNMRRYHSSIYANKWKRKSDESSSPL